MAEVMTCESREDTYSSWRACLTKYIVVCHSTTVSSAPSGLSALADFANLVAQAKALYRPKIDPKLRAELNGSTALACSVVFIMNWERLFIPTAIFLLLLTPTLCLWIRWSPSLNGYWMGHWGTWCT